MVPFLLLTLIFAVFPLLLGATHRAYDDIKTRFGKQLDILFKLSPYRKFQLAAIICLFWSFFLFIPLAIFGRLGILNINSFWYIALLLGGIFFGASCGVIAIYRDLKHHTPIILNHWLGRILLTVSTLIIGILSNSMSSNYIEEFTGYSVSNFHSADNLKWLFVILFSLLAAMIFMAVITSVLFYKDQKKIKIDESNPRNYIIKTYTPMGNIMAVTFLLMIPFVCLVFYISKLEPLFKWTFVKLNFHYFDYQECEYAPKGSSIAFLWRNTTDRNNLLVASDTTGKWTFQPVRCEMITNEPNATPKDASPDAPL